MRCDAMRWDEFDFDARTWTIPETKNGTSHVVPLSSDAIAILEQRMLAFTSGSLWVFPGTGKTGHIQDVKKSFARIKKRAGLKDLRVHDLRRTVGSHMAINGEFPYIIGAMLGHKDPKSTAVYARLNLNPVRQAIEKVHADWSLAGKSPIRTLDVSVTDGIHSGKSIEQDGSNSSKESIAVSDDMRILIEARVIYALRKMEQSKKGIYRFIPSKWKVRKEHLELVLRGLIDHGVIQSRWESKGRIHFRVYRLPGSKPIKKLPSKRIPERDSEVPELGIRPQKTMDSYVVDFQLNGRHVTRTIGAVGDLSREAARAKAIETINELRAKSESGPTDSGAT